MNDQSLQQSKSAESQQPEELADRRPYRSPQLQDFGAVNNLTQSNAPMTPNEDGTLYS